MRDSSHNIVEGRAIQDLITPSRRPVRVEEATWTGRDEGFGIRNGWARVGSVESVYDPESA